MTTDEQAIRDLIVKWHKLAAAGDSDGLQELMTDDVVFLVTGQTPMRGKHAFVEAFKASTKSVRLESTSQIEECAVLGDWAYCSTYLVVAMSKAATDEPPNRRVGYTLSVLRKENGRWKLARDANMLSTEPSGPD